MTKAEAKKILRDIERSSSEDLERAVEFARSSGRSNRATGTTIGAGAGALAGILSGGTPLQKLLRGTFGAVAGGGIGFGVGALAGRGYRSRIYSEVKKRRSDRIADLLGQLDDEASYSLQRDIASHKAGIQSNGTDYGVFVGGKGQYSGNDRLVLKKDENGRPLLSLCSPASTRL